MCFSASASFTASGLLSIVAIYCIHRAVTAQDKSFIAIALIPLLFAIQQLSEGFIWIFLQGPQLDTTIKGLSFFYLFFAYFIWPFYIPFALMIFDQARRILFLILAITGFLFGGLSFLYLLINSQLIEAKIVSHSICYLGFCGMRVNIFSIVYLILTCGSLLLSSWHLLKLLGGLLLTACICSFIFFTLTFASTWCFFSAIISVYIGFLAHQVNLSEH